MPKKTPKYLLMAIVATVILAVAGGVWLLSGDDSAGGHDSRDRDDATSPKAPPAISRAYVPTRRVAGAGELTAALNAAKPGDVIGLAAGKYEGTFSLAATGTEQHPVVVTGPKEAVLDAGGITAGYGFHLVDSEYVVLQGFTVTNAQKGVVADRVTASVIDGLTVHGIGDEAIHLRAFSSDNVVQNCVITNTGLRRPEFGEGVYLGTATSNWKNITGGRPDASDRNRVLSNTIGPDVRSEHIDIKEGTTGGEVRGNRFDGHGMNVEKFADSWVDVKGNGYRIVDNVGSFVPKSKDGGDGFQTHVIDKEQKYGRDNVFARNAIELGEATGYGVKIHKKGDSDSGKGGALGNVVCANNTIRGGRELANVSPAQSCPL